MTRSSQVFEALTLSLRAIPRFAKPIFQPGAKVFEIRGKLRIGVKFGILYAFERCAGRRNGDQAESTRG